MEMFVYRHMRRLGKIGGILAATLLLLWMTGIAGIISDGLLFYARVARLYTQEPDSRIAMPLQDVTKRKIADTWGAPRGVGRRHEGQDIFAPKGTPILSATSGYIYKIGENNLGGQTVSVIGSGGRVYYYAHLDSYAQGLEVGDRVSTTHSARLCWDHRKRTRNAASFAFRCLHLHRRDQSSATFEGSHGADHHSRNNPNEQILEIASLAAKLDQLLF